MTSFLIYGREDCPYCKNAKKFCKEKGLKCSFYDMEKQINMLKSDENHYSRISRANSLQMSRNGKTTVPKVFFYNNDTKQYSYLGGYNELVEKFG